MLMDIRWDFVTSCHARPVERSVPPEPLAPALPDRFTQFLADRVVRKPSPHTTKAYRQDFDAMERSRSISWQAG
jgi:hypothetical protein